MTLCLHSLSLLAPWSIHYHAQYKNTIHHSSIPRPLEQIFLPGFRLGQSLTFLVATLWVMTTFPQLWQPLVQIAPSFLRATWGDFFTSLAMIAPITTLLAPKMLFIFFENRLRCIDAKIEKEGEAEDFPLLSWYFIKNHPAMLPALLNMLITEEIDPIENNSLEDSYSHDSQNTYNLYLGYWTGLLVICATTHSMWIYGAFSIGPLLYLVCGILRIVINTVFPMLLFFKKSAHTNEKYEFYLPAIHILLTSIAALELTLFTYYPVPENLSALTQLAVETWFYTEIVWNIIQALGLVVYSFARHIQRKLEICH